MSAELDRVDRASPPPMYRVTRPKTVARERTEVLERRLAYLRERIAERHRGDSHFDRAEMFALAWVIDLARVEVARLAEVLQEDLRRAGEGGDCR